MKLIKITKEGKNWWLEAETSKEGIALRQFVKQIATIGITQNMGIIHESGKFKNSPHILHIDFTKKEIPITSPRV